MARTKSWWQEAKERHIWHALIAYPGLVFVFLQALEFFINHYGLDPRWLTACLITAVVFVPSVIVWNWHHGAIGEQSFRRMEPIVHGVSLLVAITAVALYWRLAPEPVDDRTVLNRAARSVAVLPFENPAQDPEVQYLCDGIAESLTNWLAGVPNLRVAARTAAFRMRGQADDNAALAKALGVDSVVRGRLERVGDQLVVSASLVDIRDDSQLWGARLAQPADGLLAMERAIVDALKSGLHLGVAGDRTGRRGDTRDPAAYHHYLRGHYLVQATDAATIGQGLDELREATRLDPQFARAWADIADALTQLLFYGQLTDAAQVAEARSAATTAVALAPDLAEAHTAMATMLQYNSFDWPAVDDAYQAAVALTPNSPVPYHRYADYLALTLQFDEAREMAAKAIGIDPLDGSSMHAVGWVELLAGNFKEAAEAFGEWNRFHPQSRWSYTKHALALALDGQCDEAAQQRAAVQEMAGGQFALLMAAWLSWSEAVCGVDGWRERLDARMQAELAANPHSTEPGLGYGYALLGEDDPLLGWMQQRVAERSPFVLFLQVFRLDHMGWAIADTFPRNPEYLALLQQAGFPDPDS